MKNNKGFSVVEALTVFCIILLLVMFSLSFHKQAKIDGARVPAAYQCVNGLLLQQDKAVMANGRPVKC